MTTIPVRELRNHTAEVLRRGQTGEDMVVTQNGVPVATLAPLRATGPRGPINRADLADLLARHMPDPTVYARDDDYRPLVDVGGPSFIRV